MSLSSRLTKWVMQQWQVRSWFSGLMTPLSWLTGAIVARKQTAYRTGKRQAHHPGVPVIVVGNILVGGTGKTPVVIAVTRYLQSRGWQPGILSRGYGTRQDDTPRVGERNLDPETFGDEPVLINRQTGAPIAVHPSRVKAAEALLHSYPHINVIVCDDGLQHLALARDIEIVVQDQRGTGNGRLLPAGPLREPATKLRDVAALITNRRDRDATGKPVAGSTHAGLPNRSPILVDMYAVPQDTRELSGPGVRPLAQWAERSRHIRVCAAAGIGQPDAFFSMLRRAGIVLASQIALPDHHDYRTSPFVGVEADIILVTAKDAVKCERLGDPRLWEVPISAAFDRTDFPGCIIDPLGPPPAPMATPAGPNLL